MIGRELAHVVSVLTGWQHLPGPLLDEEGHSRRWLSPWDYHFFLRHGFARCWKCTRPMTPAPDDDRCRPLILWSEP